MMDGFNKEDVKMLYDAFIKLCDFIEYDVECGKCPMWEDTCSQGGNGKEFGGALRRIRNELEALR